MPRLSTACHPRPCYKQNKTVQGSRVRTDAQVHSVDIRTDAITAAPLDLQLLQFNERQATVRAAIRLTLVPGDEIGLADSHPVVGELHLVAETRGCALAHAREYAPHARPCAFAEAVGGHRFMTNRAVALF